MLARRTADPWLRRLAIAAAVSLGLHAAVVLPAWRGPRAAPQLATVQTRQLAPLRLLLAETPATPTTPTTLASAPAARPVRQAIVPARPAAARPARTAAAPRAAVPAEAAAPPGAAPVPADAVDVAGVEPAPVTGFHAGSPKLGSVARLGVLPVQTTDRLQAMQALALQRSRHARGLTALTLVLDRLQRTATDGPDLRCRATPRLTCEPQAAREQALLELLLSGQHDALAILSTHALARRAGRWRIEALLRPGLPQG